MRVNLTRESVCAGDDVDAPHATSFAVPDETTVGGLARIIQDRYLPRIEGGKATWSMVTSVPVAVLAQQWSDPRLLPPFDLAVTRLPRVSGTVKVHVNYHAQRDPEAVLEVLRELKLVVSQQQAAGDAQGGASQP
ncbi:MAG: hypothetical protein JW889_09090 [Verrucomicrobia bacterium]|nr:hypothetical protein [Verrucomicrobiota bacterium]